MIRSPQQIIDAVASARLMVTPVQPYMPVGTDFVAACLAEQLADVVATFQLPADVLQQADPNYAAGRTNG